MQPKHVFWTSAVASLLLLLAPLVASAQAQSRKLSLDLYLEWPQSFSVSR